MTNEIIVIAASSLVVARNYVNLDRMDVLRGEQLDPHAENVIYVTPDILSNQGIRTRGERDKYNSIAIELVNVSELNFAFISKLTSRVKELFMYAETMVYDVEKTMEINNEFVQHSASAPTTLQQWQKILNETD